MIVFNGLKIKVVNVAGKNYAQLTFSNMAVPSNMSKYDYYLVERIDVPLSDAAAIYNAYLATAEQNVLYYMNGYTYMSTKIYMGGVDITYPSTYLDVTRQVASGISVVIDSSSDPDTFLHIYRAIAMNADGTSLDESATPYILLANTTGTDTEETTNQERPRYRLDSSGNYVILGIPSGHGTPRYNGIIESSSFISTINSVTENDKMVRSQAEHHIVTGKDRKSVV